MLLTAPTHALPTIDGSVPACDACNHPDAAHDGIAHRYCKATMTNALTRGCICSTVG